MQVNRFAAPKFLTEGARKILQKGETRPLYQGVHLRVGDNTMARMRPQDVLLTEAERGAVIRGRAEPGWMYEIPQNPTQFSSVTLRELGQVMELTGEDGVTYEIVQLSEVFDANDWERDGLVTVFTNVLPGMSYVIQGRRTPENRFFHQFGCSVSNAHQDVPFMPSRMIWAALREWTNLGLDFLPVDFAQRVMREHPAFFDEHGFGHFPAQDSAGELVLVRTDGTIVSLEEIMRDFGGNSEQLNFFPVGVLLGRVKP